MVLTKSLILLVFVSASVFASLTENAPATPNLVRESETQSSGFVESETTTVTTPEASYGTNGNNDQSTAASTTEAIPSSTPATTTKSRNIKYVWDFADVTARVNTDDGQLLLEAFKAASNDQLLPAANNDPAAHKQLYWTSIGNPRLVRQVEADESATKGRTGAVFRSTADGYYVLVNLLSEEDNAALAKAASNKYGVPVEPEQIRRIELSKFECALNLYNSEQRFLIKGNAKDLRNYPLRVDFDVPSGTFERELFDRKLLAHDDVNLACTLAEVSNQFNTKFLTLSAKASEMLGLNDRIFGLSHQFNQTAYVTSKQLVALAKDMYSSLNIAEEYGLSLSQFSEVFIDDLVKQTASEPFSLLRFEKIISDLSRLDVLSDVELRLANIKHELSSIFVLEYVGNKKVISVSKKYTESQPTDSNQASAQANSISSLFPIGVSVEFVQKSQSTWREGNKSHIEQLNELNAAQSQLTWDIDYDEVVPVAVSVASLSRLNFTKTLEFKRVRRQLYDTAYTQSVTLYTSRTADYRSDHVDNLKAQIKNLSATVDHFLISSKRRPNLPVGTVVAYSSDKAIPSKWLLCNGQAVSRTEYKKLFLAIGTTYGDGDSVSTFNLPDLRGRVIVGVDSTAVRLNNASKVGSSGGSSEHELTIAELPRHSHTAGSLGVNAAGAHTHSVNDPGHNHGGVTGSGFGGFNSYWTPHMLNNGGSAWTSESSHTHSIPTGRTGISVNFAGSHTHTLSGSTESIGEGKKFSTAPPFMAVRFIICASE